ncbi:hypothetical protein [Actinoplanes sp. NBRC 103695]|nr:hypothetical protein [Actinoplanes sp. NBRC 103695]GLY95917.1 hypothetical protein Acsp02_31720 [Actinoplanes sp. NBRC 103695]
MGATQFEEVGPGALAEGADAGQQAGIRQVGLTNGPARIGYSAATVAT